MKMGGTLPVCSARLRAIRQKTRNAIVSFSTVHSLKCFNYDWTPCHIIINVLKKIKLYIAKKKVIKKVKIGTPKLNFAFS